MRDVHVVLNGHVHGEWTCAWWMTMCTCVHIRLHAHEDEVVLHVRVALHACVHPHVQVHIHVGVCKHMLVYVRVYICIYVDMYT